MKPFNKLLLALVLVACGGSAFAQTESEQLGYEPYPYNFVQLQGGVSTLLRDNMYLTPTASVGFGRFFGSGVGARLHVNGWQSKGGFDTYVPNKEGALVSKDLTYKFRYLTTDFDLLLNLNNLFKGNDRHLLDVILVGGVGLGYAWHNGELNGYLQDNSALLPSGMTPLQSSDMFANAWGVDGAKNDHHLWTHNLRVGLLFDFNVSKHLSVGLEADLNSLDDDFNSRYSNNDDWMLTAQLSLTYKFGFKAAAPKPVPVVVEPEPAPVVEPEPEPEPAPVVVKEEPLNETIFYKIRETDTDIDATLAKCAEWAKKYPGKTISIDGYADKGTGNPTLNKEYAQKRAQTVAQKLQDKGVEASRLSVNSYGDTVQPFADNDRNRCVIIQGK